VVVAVALYCSAGCNKELEMFSNSSVRFDQLCKVGNVKPEQLLALWQSVGRLVIIDVY
jgi:hypothetical protein